MSQDPDARIDLRCPSCGSIRTPIIASPYLPENTIVVLCDDCYQRNLRRAMREDMDEKYTEPRRWEGRWS